MNFLSNMYIDNDPKDLDKLSKIVPTTTSNKKAVSIITGVPNPKKNDQTKLNIKNINTKFK